MTEDIGLSEQTLEFWVRRLAEARRSLAEAKSLLEVGHKLFLKEHLHLLNAIEKRSQTVNDDEAQLRAKALVLFGETGEKDLGYGVKIRLNEVLDYDPKIALGWALEHRIALDLNRKAFEALAKSQPLDFVSSHVEAQATIATDLDKVLKEGV